MPVRKAIAGERGRTHGLLSSALLRGDVLLAALTCLLVAFSVWCVILLSRSHQLRRDLDYHLEWVEDLRRLRGDLSSPATLQGGVDPPATAGKDADRPPTGNAGSDGGAVVYRLPPRMLEQHDAAELKVPVQAVRSALHRLRASLESGASADVTWEAAVAARSAVSDLEGHVQGQILALHGRLDDHWTTLNALIVASLLLAGSNLGLLHLAHRRRLRLEQAHAEALRRSTHDPLTRIWNRDAILRLLRRELARSKRLHSPLGVVLADVDGFQQVDVLLGEDQGDFVLEQVAERLGKSVRPYDTMGRFGGDSFLVVLPACDEIATGNVAERLRQAVNERDLEHALGHIRVTVSLAFSTVDDGADADLLIHRMQERLKDLQAEGPGRMAKLDVEP